MCFTLPVVITEVFFGVDSNAAVGWEQTKVSTFSQCLNAELMQSSGIFTKRKAHEKKRSVMRLISIGFTYLLLKGSFLVENLVTFIC